MKFRFFIVFLGLMVLGFSPKVFSQVSVNVSTHDPVYRDIDKLVGQGLVSKIIMGQRPFSRREIARIIAAAMRNLPKLEQKLENSQLSEKKRQKILGRIDYVQNILRRLKHDYREELVQLGALEGKTSWYSLHLLDQLVIDATIADSPPRSIPSNGLGFINDAQLNPLLQYRQGRNLVDGANLALEATHWIRATNHFAVYARHRAQIAIGRDGMPDNNNFYVQNLYGKIFFKNFEIEVGRDHLFYGQGKESGLILSNNPRALDMVKISNDIPFFLPWVFRYIGAHKLSFFFADLGPEQNFPNAYLTGYKWSLQPISFFEIGFALVAQSGGDGAPPASFGERVEDLLPFDQGDQIEVSNKFAGVDFRFRIPPARGAEIYGEWIFDDMDTRRLGSIFKEDSGYVVGVYLPRLRDSGDVDLRLEYHRTGIRFYEHGQFKSGYVLNHNILGDNLGPDGHAGYVWVDWDIDRYNLLTFHGAFERRSNDRYINFPDPFRFEKVEVLPKENRYRLLVSWQHRVQNLPMYFQVQFGYERVQNFNFVSGSDRNNYLGRMNFNIHLDRHTRFP